MTQIKIFTEGDNRFSQPVNPLPISGMQSHPYFPVKEQNKRHADFTKDNPPIPYIGNKPDGVYDAELFEEVWQYQGPSKLWHEIDKGKMLDYYNRTPSILTRQALTDKADVKEVEPVYHSIYADGEKCSMCKNPADRKIGEQILKDNPSQIQHELTAYVCNECFNHIFSNGKPRTSTQSETMVNDLKALVEERNVKIKELRGELEKMKQALQNISLLNFDKHSAKAVCKSIANNALRQEE